MLTSTRSQSFLDRLLAKTGGWFIVIAIIFAQLAASITLLLGFISEQLNANYAPEVAAMLNKVDVLAISLVISLQIIIANIFSKGVRASLNTWKKKPDLFRREDSNKAWKSSHSLIWRYAISAVILFIGFIVLPKTLLLSSLESVTEDQVIYGLIADLISLLAYVALSTVILDKLLAPVRHIFLPDDFSKQLSGLSNLNILNKTLVIVFFSLTITALLIAPIGYHQTTRVLYEEIVSQEVLLALQVQSIFVSVLAIVFAFGLTFLFAKSISDPLTQLMESFSKVENGDLTARSPVVSSDEISQLAIYFNRMVARLQGLQSELEKKVDERTSQLKAINEVGRVATSILDPEELLKRVVDLISKEFGYYYSAIYLIDNSGQWCDVKAASGEAGRVLKESQHQVEISSTNTIGKSIRTRQAQISLDTEDKTRHYHNPLLPYTRSEISLPLLVGDQILGALDVHSTQEAAFTNQDIETLQNMANQVAISLDNARLFQETRQRLSELRTIQKQYLREAWVATELPDGGISLAMGENSPTGEEYLAEFPITLRDQIIGKFTLGREESLSVEDKNWIEAVATQAALALENARLLEESQITAMREKFVTEITNKIWASNSIDGVLQTTVRELGQILDATEATIELNLDENRGIS
jgi:GAF domain-containing protein/HAMP domain-containing protein